MKVVRGYPPNINTIMAVFPLTGYEIFAYGDTIYNPSGNSLSPSLLAHEEVHERQQAEMGPEKWWDQYLIDAEFRLKMELEAHIMEFRTFCRINRDRNWQANYLDAISQRLASPMYGKLITRREAVSLIRRGK